MNAPHSAVRHPAELEALQTRFALRVAARLAAQAEQIPHDLSERLRVAREAALEAARAAQRLSEATSLEVNDGGSATLRSGPPRGARWFKLASLVPLAVLLAGLVAIQAWHHRKQINTAAEIDAALLADDLPPAAYRDPGFVEFLKAPPAGTGD